MKKTDVKAYKKIHEIAEEIQTAIKERRGIVSCKKLLDFLQADLPEEEFLERITSEELFFRYRQMRMVRDREKDVERLIKILNVSKRKEQKRRKFYLRISSVAAAVIVLGFGLWYSEIYRNDRTKRWDRTVTVLQVEKPTLVLSDGSKVVLQEFPDKLPDGQSGIKEITSDRLIYEQTREKAVEYNTLVVPAGYYYSVKLADGSEITLNAGSRLKYMATGMRGIREVELDGEAYFKVTPSSDPFYVRMGRSSVKVYGTEFNAYSDQAGDIEVVLVKGSVGFQTAEGREVMLEPNQKCDYHPKDGKTEVSDVNISSYVSWMRNEFNYDRVPLDYFLEKVSAWYGVRFQYDREKLKTIEFYVSAKRDMPLSDLLLLIKKGTDLTFVRESDQVFTIK